MSEKTSGSSSTLYFAVGGLVVAVLAIGYFTIGRSTGNNGSGTAAGGAASVAARGPNDQADSSFKLDIERDGSVSGSINQHPEAAAESSR